MSEKEIKTEMQQLEENTKLQYARERAEDIGKRLIELLEIELEKWRWYARAHIMLGVVMVLYFVNLGILVFSNVGAETTDNLLDWTFLLYFFAYARACWHAIKWMQARGERKGFEEALKMLGMLDVEECDCDNCKGKKKKKRVFESPFKRFKELWERLGSRNKQEAYGAA